MSAQTSPSTRRQEIILVAGRELRAHLMKKSTIILTLVLLAAAIGGIIGVKLYTSGQDKAYRLGLKGIETSQATGLDKVVASNGEAIELVDVSDHEAKEVLADDAPEGTPHVDMVLDVSGSAPTITVEEKADETVVSGATAFLQQSALGQQIASLGGDPAQVATQLSDAKPEVTVLHAPKRDATDFRQRYTVLMAMDVLLLVRHHGRGSVHRPGRGGGEVEPDRGNPPGLHAAQLTAGRQDPGDRRRIRDDHRARRRRRGHHREGDWRHAGHQPQP